MNYAMFTPEGNQLVDRIVKAANDMKEYEGVERVWDWTVVQLEKLSYGEGFEEATDTAVREAVYDAVVCG